MCPTSAPDDNKLLLLVWFLTLQLFRLKYHIVHDLNLTGKLSFPYDKNKNGTYTLYYGNCDAPP